MAHVGFRVCMVPIIRMTMSGLVLRVPIVRFKP